MPTFDTSTIQGFDAMSAEDKLAALLKVDLPDMSKYVSKDVFDKKASEAAGLTKQLRDKMTEDEAKKADDEKALADMRAELDSLRKDKTISDYTSRYLALGYDKELAESTAKAMADGDMATVFANGEKHKNALEKKIKADLMKGTPAPDGAGGKKDGEDAAVEKAKDIAKSKNVTENNDILNRYKK